VSAGSRGVRMDNENDAMATGRGLSCLRGEGGGGGGGNCVNAEHLFFIIRCMQEGAIAVQLQYCRRLHIKWGHAAYVWRDACGWGGGMGEGACVLRCGGFS